MATGAKGSAAQWSRIVPYLLALFFALWSFRGIEGGNIVDTDAARHATNGAFVHDMVWSGEFTRPIDFGKFYYGRLPALSLPYHAPGLPAMEAVFFSVLGVNLFAARLTVALTVAVSVLLLYFLIVSIHGSRWLAAMSVATFCLWSYSQTVAADVMQEFPALAFALAALWLIRKLDAGYPWLSAIAFAVLAAAAVWTKQHAVFLGAVPFLYFLFTGRLCRLFGVSLWTSSVVFGALVFGLTLLSRPFHGVGVNQASPIGWIGEIFVHNLQYYMRAFTTMLGGGTLGTILALAVGVIVAATSLPVLRKNRDGHLPFFAAWAAAAFLVLLLIGPYDSRYLFFVLPPLTVIIYTALWRFSAFVLPAAPWAAPSAAAACWIVFGLMVPSTYLQGPSQAAAAVMAHNPARVLYCGSLDGNFIFAIRSLDPALRTIVISGEKIGAAARSPQGFEQFARRFGIERVVIERSSRPQPCDALETTPSPSMVLESRIPLDSSNPRWRGHLSTYQFTNPSANPEDQMTLEIEKIAGSVEVKF